MHRLAKTKTRQDRGGCLATRDRVEADSGGGGGGRIGLPSAFL